MIQSEARRCTGPRMQRCLLPSPPRGRGKGKGKGKAAQPTPPPTVFPTDINEPSVVEELALCEEAFVFDNVLHSNLGGAGPDSGSADLVFGNVALGTNLVVAATSPYTPNMLNPAGGVLRNGVRQGFGVINMASGSEVELTFSLVDSATGAPKTHPGFVITFFDGDHGMAHESRESVTVTGFTSYSVSADTTLTVAGTVVDDASLAGGEGLASFTSTLRGSKEDNPVSPMSLSGLQKRRSFSVYFENKAEFAVKLSETGYVNPQGRNVFFAGSSNMICEREARCSSYECPAGFQMRQDAEFNVCIANPCGPQDNELCCSEIPTQPPPPPTQPPSPAMCMTYTCPSGWSANAREASTSCRGNPCSSMDVMTCCEQDRIPTGPPGDYYGMGGTAGMGGWR